LGVDKDPGKWWKENVLFLTDEYFAHSHTIFGIGMPGLWKMWL